jgi:hypothetical protein
MAALRALRRSSCVAAPTHNAGPPAFRPLAKTDRRAAARRTAGSHQRSKLGAVLSHFTSGRTPVEMVAQEGAVDHRRDDRRHRSVLLVPAPGRANRHDNSRRALRGRCRRLASHSPPRPRPVVEQPPTLTVVGALPPVPGRQRPRRSQRSARCAAAPQYRLARDHRGSAPRCGSTFDPAGLDLHGVALRIGVHRWDPGDHRSQGFSSAPIGT